MLSGANTNIIANKHVFFWPSELPEVKINDAMQVFVNICINHRGLFKVLLQNSIPLLRNGNCIENDVVVCIYLLLLATADCYV